MSVNTAPRRSSRIKALVKEKPVRKIIDDQSDDEELNLRRQTRIADEDKELESIEEDIQKPTELFFDDDISGEKIYGFDTPIKKNAMTQKANLCRTPLSVTISKSKAKPRVVLENLNANSISRKETITQKRFAPESLSSDSESISEPSDYVPSDEESGDSEEGNSTEDEEETDDDDAVSSKNKTSQRIQKSMPRPVFPSTPRKPGTKHKSGMIYKDFHMQADEYFETQSEKVITSDRTLGRLKNSRLTKDKLEELLAGQSHQLSKHKSNICKITESYMELFPMWYFLLEEGYTVLLHGVGSKRSLINDFHKTVVADHPTLIVNGFFPSLTVKDIIDGIVIELLDQACPGSLSDSLTIIEKTMNKNRDDRLYLLIHNIDGLMLRSNKSQDILSSLANIANVYVLGSVDHINSPLLWDHVKRSRFNFYWWDTTTFLPYREETSYESSLLVQQSGALALSSLHNVFLSLTTNAKAVYILLANNQLSNSGNTNFAGMAFRDLYRAAREGFLVSSDSALRAQLTEFIDHKLVKTKRDIDGVEHLVIPMNNNLLKKFLEEHES